MDSPLVRYAGSENSDQVRSAALESRSLLSHRNRAQHLLANFLVLLGFRAAGWQSNVEQLLNGLDIMHAQALKLLRRQVFLDVLAIIGRQDNICYSPAFCRQRILLDVAAGKHITTQ